jgi:hypothetical protein
MGTALKDAEGFQVLMFLGSSSCVCSLWPDRSDDQTILQLLPSVLKHHWCNSLTSCSYSMMQFVHILHLHLVHQVPPYPHRKKFKGVKCGDLGGYATGTPFPIHLPGNCWSRRLSLSWHNVEGQSHRYHKGASSSKMEPLCIMPTQWKRFLISSFTSKWIGRGGPIIWPRKSPNWTPLDLFLWEYIQDLVYQTKVQDVDELYRITANCETVTPVMLQNTWWVVEYCLDIYWATKGAHVEIYWVTSKLGNFSASFSVVPMFLSVLV